MKTTYILVTFTSIIAILWQQTFAATATGCPTGIASKYRRSGSACTDYLDCSNQAVDISPLDDTLLNGAQLKSCTDASSTPYPSCPPSGFNSGTSWSKIPSSSCSFCFKIVITRWKKWPANKGTACTRKRRGNTQHNLWYDPNRSIVEVPKGTNTRVIAEKIGPDPVTVQLLVTYLGVGDLSGIPKLYAVEFFGFGYQEKAITFYNVNGVIEVQLVNPSYGIIGMPGLLMIQPI